MFRGSYTAGSVAFLLLSKTLPAFCLRIFPQNAGRRMVGRIALAPVSCIQNRPGFHRGNRGGSFALGALFQALTQNLARGLWVSPAYAGKSDPEKRRTSDSGDYPHICGGKGHLTLAVSHMHRINPAYAGKRESRQQDHTITWDHPRVCGEKARTLIVQNEPQGSPPRMRGKD